MPHIYLPMDGAFYLPNRLIYEKQKPYMAPAKSLIQKSLEPETSWQLSGSLHEASLVILSELICFTKMAIQ